jgi:hypothetical protein
VRSFRTLGGLAQRLGLFRDGGADVRSLPYSEGQLLVTTADDWSNVRVPLQLQTWGAFLTQPLVVANFRVACLIAGRRAVRLWHVDAIGSAEPVAVSRTDGNPGAETLASVTALEGNQVSSALSTTARFVGYAAQPGAFIGVGFVLHSLANEFTPTTWLPRLLLPGERLFFQGPAGGALQLSIAWSEYPDSDDVLTSAAPRGQ